jgi:hypothetical protein
MSSVNIDSEIALTPVPVTTPSFGVVTLVLLVLASIVVGFSLPRADLSFGSDYQSAQLTGP